MPDSSLTTDLVHRFPIAMIRLHGELTAGGVAPAHKVLVEALAEEPTSLVIDVGGLTAVDDRALAVFPEVAELSAQWPGAPLLLCGANPPVREALGRAGVTGALPVHVTYREAIAVASADPVPRRIHQFLEPTPNAPRAARELVAQACWDWDLPTCATSAQVLASELVSNAVRHARTTVGFAVTLGPARLRISARDWSPQPVRRQDPAAERERGRGLVVVDTVAEDWGQVSFDGGKVVWAVLPVPRPVSAAAPEKEL